MNRAQPEWCWIELVCLRGDMISPPLRWHCNRGFDWRVCPRDAWAVRELQHIDAGLSEADG